MPMAKLDKWANMELIWPGHAGLESNRCSCFSSVVLSTQFGHEFSICHLPLAAYREFISVNRFSYHLLSVTAT